MTGMEQKNPNEQDPQALIESASRYGGVIHEIASELIEPGITLENPAEVWDVILPPREGVEIPRWQLAEDAGDRKKALATENSQRIYDLADRTSLRKSETLTDADIQKLADTDPDTIMAVVEGGANETAAKRGYLLSEALDKANVPIEVPMFYVATEDYKIPVEKNGAPNKEQDKARAVADGLPEGDLNQFQVTKGTLERLGFSTAGEVRLPGAGTFVEYEKEGERKRIVVKPEIEGERGTVAGLLAINASGYRELQGASPVLGTNGQYRQKLALQAELAAVKASAEPGQTPQVFGDEAGFEVPFPDANGETIVFKTAARNEVMYLNEFASAGKVQIEIKEAVTRDPALIEHDAEAGLNIGGMFYYDK